jgi:hypothetical protein
MSADARPGIERAMELFRARFLNRTDLLSAAPPWPAKACPVEVGGDLDRLLAAHVAGERMRPVSMRFRTKNWVSPALTRVRIGVHAPAPEGTTRWVCVDFDGVNHAAGLADPLAAALAGLRSFEAAGLPAYLERSGSGRGFHLWAFFEPAIPAVRARALARALVPRNLPLIRGGEANPLVEMGIEIFPKQDKLRRGGIGSAVWLPWWHGAAEGGNLFVRPAGSGTVEPYLPEELRTASPGDVERVFGEHEATLTPGSAAGPRRRGRAGSSHAPSPWADWRRRALAALRLEDVYGPWLTGRKSGESWLECRDPDSPSGDQNPSAGVADGTGGVERGAFHSFITGRTLSLFDFLVERGGASDFQAAQLVVAKLSGVALPEAKGTGGRREDSQTPAEPHSAAFTLSTLPTIIVNARHLRDIVADTWSAIHTANRGPTLFVRTGALVRLRHEDAAPILDTLDEDGAYGHLARVADWVVTTRDGESPVFPPRPVARDIRAYPDAKLPPIDAVVRSPLFAPDGHIVATPGYHPVARVWLHLDPGFEIEPVPETPSHDDTRAALSLLVDELLVDFPFLSDSDRAHSIAAILLPFVRRLIPGCTPAHVIEAPSPGSGKGLLADVIAQITTGTVCPPTTLPVDEDEIRKKVTSLLVPGPPIVLLDNVHQAIDSASIASVLTTTVWEDRLLGKTQILRLPNQALWLITANNPRLSLEMARRSIRIRLEPVEERPWLRSGFKHDPLREWVAQNRLRLVRAALVLVQSWIAAGRPPGTRTLGSYEPWARMMGGILRSCGVAGFLEDLEAFYEVVEIETQMWRPFIHAWWNVHAGNAVSADQLVQVALTNQLLGDLLVGESRHSQVSRLGMALKDLRDRRIGHFQVRVTVNAHRKAAEYRLVRVEPGASGGGEPDGALDFDLADLEPE